jgi:hypothetical protein
LLVKVEPGRYDVAGPLFLKDNVTIEGSGSEATAITSSAGGATVVGATSRGTTISDLAIVAGPGGTAVFVQSGLVKLADDAIFASNGASVYGIRVVGGAASLQGSTVRVDSTTPNAFVAGAQSESGSVIELLNSRVTAEVTANGGFATALSVNGAAVARASSLIAIAPNLGMKGIAVIANGSGSIAQIDASLVRGDDRAAGAGVTDTIEIGASRVEGGHDAAAPGTVKCIDSYKADYATTLPNCD